MGGQKGQGKSMVLSSKGKAIVEFSQAYEAQNALTMLNGAELDGRRIKVDAFMLYQNSKEVKGEITAKVYVGNLAYKTQSWKLKEFFGQAGTVKYVKVLR